MRSQLDARHTSGISVTPHGECHRAPRVFDRESEYRAAFSMHNEKNYAVLAHGHLAPLAIFGYSDLAVQWRDEYFPAAEVAEITAVLPPVTTLTVSTVSPGEPGHALL